jgi:hypothetical protein
MLLITTNLKLRTILHSTCFTIQYFSSTITMAFLQHIHSAVTNIFAYATDITEHRTSNNTS